VGVLFWVAFILLVLVIFLANRGNIEQVLESTGIVDTIRERVARNEEPEEPGPQAPAESVETNETTEPEDPVRVVVQDEQPEEARDPAPEVDPAPEPVETVDVNPVETPQTVVAEPASDPQLPNRRMAALYYIKVTDDGHTMAHRVVRPVAYDQSPLTETIRALIAGPTGEELDDGLLNLIPPNTELISAHVTAGVAYLNFNQSFRFNPLGAEGTVAQLQQIIFSSTEFPTVTQVQFLIEGEQLDYMGGDGIYIGEPLGRDAFTS
jgi:germination protein M